MPALLYAQGCQMVCFQTQNTNLGKFWKALYFMTIWNILWPFGTIYGRLVYIVCGHLVYSFHFGRFGPRKIWQPCCTVVSADKHPEMLLLCAQQKKIASLSKYR
jgi:hypothetical protein